MNRVIKLCFIGMGIIAHRHAALLCLVLPLLRASGKDKTMKTPKTPYEFDYDLWTTEDGKCMVRIKLTGEVTEVDREVMKILRAEEKKMRRSYEKTLLDAINTEENRSMFLSLDALPDESVTSSAWLADPKDVTSEVVTNVMIKDFKQSLCPLYLSVFEHCILDGMTVREYAATYRISKSYVSKIERAVRADLKKFFDF